MEGKVDCEEFWLIMISLCKLNFVAPILEGIVNKDMG